MEPKTMFIWKLCVFILVLPSTNCALNYIGCYKDTHIRAMRYRANVKSIEDCVQFCRREGERVAGLEFSRECFCGDNYNKYGQGRFCVMKCQSGEICGGPWHLSVYRVDEPVPPSKLCEKTVADIVFLLDDSGSVGLENFNKVKEFAINVIRSLKISTNQVRVASISFSGNAYLNFYLNKYDNQKDLIEAIRNIRYRRGSTNTHLALLLLQTVFMRNVGDRKGVPNIAIVVTDGKSNIPSLTKKEAAKLQKDGVVMFSIGIGRNLRESELIAMASKPTSEHKFNVDNFDVLHSITEKVTKKACQAKADCTCTASGDPHYRTFDGQMIHFMGICKYTLAASTNNTSHFFAVEVKNEHRGSTRVSYTRMVDIKLKNVTIRLLPMNRILVNGEKRELPIKEVLGFSAIYSAGWITVTTDWGLRVQFDGRHRVTVKLRGSFANTLTGICGDCNGIKDDLRTKEGKDVSADQNKFSLIGKSYIVHDDSDNPQTNCAVTDVTTTCPSAETKACDIIMSDVFEDCRMELEPITIKEYLESCKTDVCAYHNKNNILKTVVCEALEGFARECEKVGITADWRSISKCGMQCGENQVYEYDALVCQPSCTDRYPDCEDREEGCVCKKGFILSGENCVPVSKCGCNSNGIYMLANEVRVDVNCRLEITCHGNGKLDSRMLQPCGSNSVCDINNGIRGCVCKEVFQLANGKCIPKVRDRFIRVSMAYIKGNALKIIYGIYAEECSKRCLHIKDCKSFNYDMLKKVCELLSINAEDHTLIPRKCPDKEYYQRIESRDIVIRGASIFTCVHLAMYKNVKTIAECRVHCEELNCKAMEYSVSSKQCSVTHTTRESFGLIGNLLFTYYETLDYDPQLVDTEE